MAASRSNHPSLAFSGTLVVACSLGAGYFFRSQPDRPERIVAQRAEVAEEPSSEAILAHATALRARRMEAAEALQQKEQLARDFASAQQEFTLIDRLRTLEFSDPEQSIRLAEDFARRFPNSTYAPERAWYQARNLVYLQRFDEARQLALQTNEQYPNDWRTRDLVHHLLSHPFGLPPRGH